MANRKSSYPKKMIEIYKTVLGTKNYYKKIRQPVKDVKARNPGVGKANP